MGIVNIDSVEISLEMLNLISQIDQFKGAWKLLGKLNPERLDSLQTVAAIESIGSSTRIEGSKLTDKQIQKLLFGLAPQSFRTRDEQEVAGYAYVCEKIYQHYQEMPVTENVIKQLHGWLLSFSDKDHDHRGSYKKIPIRIEAFDENKLSIGVLFETTSPFETPIKIRDLVMWYNDVLEKNTVHPLIAIGIFVVLFLAIHPFQDGNGRLSRLLTTLMMLRCEYAYVVYSSMESIIEANKEGYYKALQVTQKAWQRNQPDWNPWLNFFLSCLQKQKIHLESKLKEIAKIADRMTPLQIKILECLKIHNTLSISDIAILTQINRNTLKKNLESLVKRNLVLKQGVGKATRYSGNQ